MIILEAKAAVHMEWKKLNHLFCREGRNNNTSAHFGSLMDLSHLKHAKLIKNTSQGHRESGVTGEQGDSGYQAVFTGQGTSASEVAEVWNGRRIQRRSLRLHMSHEGRSHTLETYKRKTVHELGLDYLGIPNHKDKTTSRTLSYHWQSTCTAILWQD